MNLNGVALESVEADGTYEHLSPGAPEEGYALFYFNAAGDHVAYDVFFTDLNMGPATHQVVRSDALELVKLSDVGTLDGLLRIRQTFTWSTNATRVDIRMEVTNLSSGDLSDVLIKRYADLDVDTGGSRGWAGFENHWLTNRDSVMAFDNPSEAAAGYRAHIVNMVAMPGDFPYLGSFAGLFGGNQYNQRPNLYPVPSPNVRVDGVAVLQWHGDRLRSGETVRLHCYYDVYCLCSDVPLPGPPWKREDKEAIVLPDGTKYKVTQSLKQDAAKPTG